MIGLIESATLRTERRALWALAGLFLVGLGIQTWSVFSLGPAGTEVDGTFYLDLATQIAHGDWSGFLNRVWSPLYPALLAVLLKLGVAPLWEAPAARLLNAVITAWVLWRLLHFLQEFRLCSQEPDATGWPYRWAFAAALLYRPAVEEHEVLRIGPDMLVAGFVFWAMALTCRLWRGAGGRKTAWALGFVLGAACLAKTVFFPLGALLTAGLWTPRFGLPDRSLARWAVAGAFCVTAPYVSALSLHYGEFSVGEVGPLNYAWHVERKIPKYYGWSGYPLETGRPTHPPVFPDPHVIVMDGPSGTLPFFDDPAYFHEGLRTSFDWRRQWEAFRVNLSRLWEIRTETFGLCLGSMALAVLKYRRRGGGTRTPLLVLVWPLTAFLMYLAIHVEKRYYFAFYAVIWVFVYDWASPRASRAAQAIFVAATLWVSAPRLRETTKDAVPIVFRESQVKLTAELGRLGLRRGEKIAVVGDPFQGAFARMAGLSATAFVAWKGDWAQFWNLTPESKQRIYQALTSAGVRALVARNGYCRAATDLQGWIVLDDRAACIRMLPRDIVAQPGRERAHTF